MTLERLKLKYWTEIHGACYARYAASGALGVRNPIIYAAFLLGQTKQLFRDIRTCMHQRQSVRIHGKIDSDFEERDILK